MSLIRAENISFVYSTGTSFEKKALDNVSFEIEKGEFVGIIGHTGSGKSTLIQLLNGLLKPTEGNIFFDEKNIWDEPKKIRNIRFRVGMVFQYPEYQLFEETVYKDIAFGPHNMGLDDDETDKRIHKAAEFVGLREDQLLVSPFELSGGEKRRAAIAGVIAMDPDVLILDEPFHGLDNRNLQRCIGIVNDFCGQSGKTLVFVTHNAHELPACINHTFELKYFENQQ